MSLDCPGRGLWGSASLLVDAARLVTRHWRAFQEKLIQFLIFLRLIFKNPFLLPLAFLSGELLTIEHNNMGGMVLDQEKLNRYLKRTVEHIHRVQNNMVTVLTKYRDFLGLSLDDCRILMHQVMEHDQSKFSFTQFEPYIELTEFYYQRKTLGNKDYDYPSIEIKRLVDLAVNDHYRVENHHPEALKAEGLVPVWNRYRSIETVCDLQAMAQEFDEGSCRGFWEKVWMKKQAQYFSVPEWSQVLSDMDKVITCFERELESEG